MAVTTVKLDDVAKSRSSNLATMLQGRMPGVTIQQTGDPMKPASFSIRGRGSKGNDDDPTSGDGVLVVCKLNPRKRFVLQSHPLIFCITFCISIGLIFFPLNPQYTFRSVPHSCRNIAFIYNIYVRRTSQSRKLALFKKRGYSAQDMLCVCHSVAALFPLLGMPVPLL